MSNGRSSPKTCPSDKPRIYYLEVEVMWFHRKRAMKRKSWAISVFVEPKDLMLYDRKTMRRLERECYKNRKGERTVVITDVTVLLPMSHSFRSIDEHKRINRNVHE